MSSKTIQRIRINMFNPEILDTRRLHGSPPTVVVIGKRGCMLRDTLILTDDGKTKMVQDIKVGDKLMGDDSKPRTVLSLCQGQDKMYKIKQLSGMDYIVNGDHILSLKNSDTHQILNYEKGDVVDIKVRDYLNLSSSQKIVLKGYKVPVIFPIKKLPLDPYAMGIWLGDKSGLNTKHIPDVYKYNSRENQLKLLAGILDIDGYHNVETGCYDIVQKNYTFAKDIEYIARCLGFTANVVENSCCKSNIEETFYTQSISGIGLNDIPCLNSKKQVFCEKENNLYSEIEIEPLGEDIYYGFQLDGNQRFLLEDFTVTHNSGKSTLIADLMWYMRKTPMFICMSGTEEGNGFYGKHMHPLLIHGEYKKNIVSSLIRQQKDKLKKCLKAGIEPNSRPDLGTGLLLDDCGFNKKLFYQEDIRLLFMNGRHWKICFIVSLQYMMGIPPDLRTNIDFVFCLRENIVANQRKLYDNFFGCFKKFAEFQEAFNECTENYECLVLDNTAKSTKVENCVFYYKAKPDRDYKLGSRDLWSYLNSRYKENEDEDEDEDDRGRSSIVIKKAPMVKIIQREDV